MGEREASRGWEQRRYKSHTPLYEHSQGLASPSPESWSSKHNDQRNQLPG